MLFWLGYLLVRGLLGAGGRRPDEKDIELLELRHQEKVLQRQVKRPRLNRLDRVLLAAASRAMTRSSWSSFGVKPETLQRQASGTGQEEVDTQEVGSAWPASDRSRSPRPRRPPRQAKPTVGVAADPRGADEARDQDLRDDGPHDPAATRPGPCSPPGRPNVDRVPAVTGVGDPGDRLLHRRDDQAEDHLGPVLHRTLDPASAPLRASPRSPTRRGSPSKPASSPSKSGFGVFGSSCATGTSRSRDRSMTSSAPRASASCGRQSAHLERMHARSGSVRTVRRECLDHVLIYARRHLERVLQAYVAHSMAERHIGD